MNEILFVLFLIAIIMATKYHVFDVPLRDKKLYLLDAYFDELEDLVSRGVICKKSYEYTVLNNLIKNQHFLIEHEVPYKFIIDFLSYKESSKKKKQSDKTIQTLKENEEIYTLYTNLNEFYVKNIYTLLDRKVRFLLRIITILIAIRPIFEIIDNINKKTNRILNIDLIKVKKTNQNNEKPTLEYLANTDLA